MNFWMFFPWQCTIWACHTGRKQFCCFQGARQWVNHNILIISLDTSFHNSVTQVSPGQLWTVCYDKVFSQTKICWKQHFEIGWNVVILLVGWCSKCMLKHHIKVTWLHWVMATCCQVNINSNHTMAMLVGGQQMGNEWVVSIKTLYW